MSVAKVFTKLTKRFIDARARRRKAKEQREFVFVLESDEVLHASATKIQVAWRQHVARKKWKGAISKVRALAVENEMSGSSDGGGGFMLGGDESKSSDESEHTTLMRQLQRQGSVRSGGTRVTLENFNRDGTGGGGGGGAAGGGSDSEERRAERRRRRKKAARKRRERRERRRERRASRADLEYSDEDDGEEGGRHSGDDSHSSAGTRAVAAALALQPEEAMELAELEAEEDDDPAPSQEALRPEFERVASSIDTNPTVRRAVEKLQGLVRIHFARRELRQLRAARDAREVRLAAEEMADYRAAAAVIQRHFRAYRARKQERAAKRHERDAKRSERRRRLAELRARQRAAESDDETDPEEEQRQMEEFLARTDAYELDTIEVAFSCFAKRDGGGQIRTAQIGPFLSTIGQEPESNEELRHIVADMDQSGRGAVTFEEFANWYRKRKTLFTPQALISELFNMFDGDRNGYINPRELLGVMTKLKAPVTEEEAYAMVQALDTDLDGQVSLSEFRAVALLLL